MKKKLTVFSCGIFVGLIPFGFQFFWSTQPTDMEVSLAQIVYERLNEYTDAIDLDTVLSLAKKFVDHKLPLKNEKDLYAPLMHLAEKNAENYMAATLQKAESYLKNIASNPKIKIVVPDRVFVEVIQEGEGEVIGVDDAVSLYFKEFAPDGSLVKDTMDRAYTIPLSQTIKGFQLGLDGARVGETRKLYLHPEYGFGKMGRKAPNKLLIYEVTIAEKKRALPPIG